MTYEELLLDLVTKDSRFVVMTSENRAAMRNITSKIKDNFIDTGITEQTQVGMAAGLALRGRIPIVHALATFITMRAFEFIRTDIGIPGFPVKVVGGVPGFLSDGNGPTHQAVEDISIMRGIPNVNVFSPADEDDLLKCLPEILGSSSPFYIRYNNSKPAVEHSKFELGKAEVFGSGTDIAILTHGLLFAQAYKAKEILEAEGKSVRVLNLRTLKPLDEDAVLKAVKECSLVVTLEDHFITGGLYTILAELLLRNRLTADVLPFALNNKWFKPGLLIDVLQYEGFTAEQIAAKINSYKFKI